MKVMCSSATTISRLAPEMHSADEPPQIRGVLDEDDAGVGWGGVARTVWNVVEAKQKTGNELDRDQDHRNTAEITVAGGRVVRNPAIELGVNRSRELQALVEPIDDGGLQSHRR